MDILLDLPLDEPAPCLYAVIWRDDAGNEGIMSMNGMPMVFVHKRTLKSILGSIEKLAQQVKKKVSLVKYTQRETIEEIKP